MVTMKINYEDFKNLSSLNKWLRDNESVTIINVETITLAEGICYRLWFSGEINRMEINYENNHRNTIHG